MVRFLAHFDGRSILPDEPVCLPTDKPLQVTVEEVEAVSEAAPLGLAGLFDAIEAECGLAEGPEDWAAEMDHYVYGSPKRRGRNGG